MYPICKPLPKCAADEIECNRVDAGIDEGKTKRNNPKRMPEVVVVVLSVWVEVEPEVEDLIWSKADEKQRHESQNHLSHFLSSFHL